MTRQYHKTRLFSVFNSFGWLVGWLASCVYFLLIVFWGFICLFEDLFCLLYCFSCLWLGLAICQCEFFIRLKSSCNRFDLNLFTFQNKTLSQQPTLGAERSDYFWTAPQEELWATLGGPAIEFQSFRLWANCFRNYVSKCLCSSVTEKRKKWKSHSKKAQTSFQSWKTCSLRKLTHLPWSPWNCRSRGPGVQLRAEFSKERENRTYFEYSQLIFNSLVLLCNWSLKDALWFNCSETPHCGDKRWFQWQSVICFNHPNPNMTLTPLKPFHDIDRASAIHMFYKCLLSDFVFYIRNFCLQI